MSTAGAFGGYDDWADHLARTPRVPGRVGDLLGVPVPTTGPVREGAGWVRDGVLTTRLRWSVGFGPDNAGWLLHPADTDPARLPGVLALPSHGGVKSLGAERMVDVPGVPAHVLAYRDRYEGGRAVANDLARGGLTVLVPDAFTFGARRFDLGAEHPATYDALAVAHEELVAKACALLDTTLAGMVAHDDLASLDVLRRRCAPGPVGALGFSGGGGRALVLAALDPGLRSLAVVAMMCTLRSLFPDHVGHSWLLHTRGLAAGPDLPGLAAFDTTREVFVGYCTRDELFPRAGMEDADAHLAAVFAGEPGRYTALWEDAPHAFTPALQAAAIDHLTTSLLDHSRKEPSCP